MKTIKAEDIPVDETARKFLEEIDLSDGEVVVEQAGKPRLVLVSPRLIEQRRQAKEQLFQIIEQIRRRNPNVHSDDVLRELEELDHPEPSAP